MPEKAPRFKAVSIMNDDYEYIEKIRLQWVEKHKANLPMPQFIKAAAANLEATL